jgi:transposase
VVIKGRDAADAPQLPELVDLTAQHYKVREVSADKAYSVLYNLQAIERAGAKAYIPHKSNHTENRGGMWATSVNFYRDHRDEFNAHYRKRSNVETSFGMIKARFTGYVRGRTERAQVNEVLAKVLCHNIVVLIQSIYELDLVPDFTNSSLAWISTERN